MTMSIHLKARDIGLDLPIYTQAQRGARASLSLLRAAFQPPKRHMRTTLEGISFDLAAGDRIGIIGRNGAGKSTLLKILVGAYPPSRGYIEVAGTRQALLNLTLGFNGEATVIENILLRGIAMGLRSREASYVVEEVLEFSELGEKAGDRLRTLSSGQKMRLGFALATSVQHDILLMDEWIGAGDASFVSKAKERIQSRVDNAKIVVLASHNTKLMRDVCNKGIVLEQGRMTYLGDIDEALEAYTASEKGAKTPSSK
jgi:ABC-type polysaccharide/polyol phosphate transport system ATPase subunit